ncbi:DVU_1551 family NTP transferase [Fundidesulfovibrio terrae]|uniref:DVU_1551 family NTP transferase n=1 Tax=Fundidesulfovibrio terrae TaxID=2922866 RepID=UPI001FAEFACC
MRVAALVPAAGLSSRMDGFKPLLPLRGSTVLGCVTRSLREAGVEDILAVAGHKAGEVYAEAARLQIGCVVNREYEQGMFSSILTGIAALPGGVDAVLVLPVDIPLVRPQTIRSLLDRFGDRPIAYPTFLGERGHPPLIRSDCLPFISSWKEDGGLRATLSELEKRLGADETPVADANILFDLDTPQNYREALRRVRRRGRPTPGEAQALLEIHCVNERGLAHAHAVARIALALATALNEARGWPLDMDLTQAAALLHDIAKKRKNHEAEGGRILDAAGFPDAARIVEAHRDLSIPDIAPITEREVVYLADKLVCCDSPVSVHRRFQEKLDRFGHDPEAFTAISGRRDRALAMLARVERESGLGIKAILERAGLYHPPGEPSEAGA